jgi:hypothetical protein
MLYLQVLPLAAIQNRLNLQRDVDPVANHQSVVHKAEQAVWAHTEIIPADLPPGSP